MVSQPLGSFCEPFGSGESGGRHELRERKGRARRDWTINDLEGSDNGIGRDRIGDKHPVSQKIERPFLFSKAQEDWLKVPRALTFFSSGIEGLFEAKIRIQNLSPWHIAYCVRSYSGDKLSLKSKIGWIEPKKQIEVIVMTKPGKITDFGSLCREVFEIFGTPVYFASQLHKKKIRLLWKAYGSESFPFDAAEVHKVDQMVPALDSYMDNYNITERACLGNYVAGTYVAGMHLEWPDQSVDDTTFDENWEPTDSHPSVMLEISYQMKDWKNTIKALKTQMESIVVCVKCVIAASFTIGLSFAVSSIAQGTFPFQDRLHGPNGQPLHQASEPTPWWKFF